MSRGKHPGPGEHLVPSQAPKYKFVDTYESCHGILVYVTSIVQGNDEVLLRLLFLLTNCRCTRPLSLVNY